MHVHSMDSVKLFLCVRKSVRATLQENPQPLSALQLHLLNVSTVFIRVWFLHGRYFMVKYSFRVEQTCKKLYLRF
jgi:hypothetical protein